MEWGVRNQNGAVDRHSPKTAYLIRTVYLRRWVQARRIERSENATPPPLTWYQQHRPNQIQIPQISVRYVPGKGFDPAVSVPDIPWCDRHISTGPRMGGWWEWYIKYRGPA
eukprot:3846004-Rhodomonas_salina.3